MCAFCTIEYDIANGPETTGNYFEVTILLLGEMDIGVGLAEPSFPFTQHMPGWIDGSYGMFDSHRTPLTQHNLTIESSISYRIMSYLTFPNFCYFSFLLACLIQYPAVCLTGYHGDDGRKFGRNATIGDWPLFEAG